MAHEKRMIKFNKEQWDIMVSGKIILNKYALLPRQITPLNDEQYIMDCILFQSQELIKNFKKAQEQQKKGTDADVTADTPTDTEGNTTEVLRSQDNISSEKRDDPHTISAGTKEESEEV